MDIDDTSDRLGVPSLIENCKQHMILLENEIDDLNRQLRLARENTFRLVQMHA